MEVAGKPRTLKFGMRCSKLIAQHSANVKKKIQENPEASAADHFDQLALFFWAALKAKESENDLPEGFDLSVALDWLDDLPSKSIEVIMAMGGECLGFIEKYSQILTEKERRQQILQAQAMPTQAKKAILN